MNLGQNEKLVLQTGTDTMTSQDPVLTDRSENMDFSKKVVLITGASSGIGAACALKFSLLSAKLSLTGRNEVNLNEIARKCEEISGLKPLIIKADISHDEDITNIVNKTLDFFGQIDVLVNNAGITTLGGIHAGIVEYDSIMATNLRGPYLLTSLLIPHLIKTRGNIVNVSSSLSKKPNPMLLPYCMSKAAMDMFTKCLALELGPEGVRVNSVNPGPVRTEIFRKAGVSEEDNKNLFAVMTSSLPLKRVTTTEEVAEVVTFLASEKAKSVTGSRYTIDCGLLLGHNIKF